VRLSIKPLKNFNNVNNFEQTTEWFVQAGTQNRLYFQLVNLDRDELRYIPTEDPVTLTIDFPAIIPTQVLTKTATKFSELDRSIWYVDILATDVIFSGSIRLTLNENGKISKFSALDVVMVEQHNQGGC
jgi:hypothetical protein